VDEDRLWTLIAECRRESGNDAGLAARVLFRRLRNSDAATVIAFVDLWERAASCTYRLTEPIRCVRLPDLEVVVQPAVNLCV
jgi:hypothetical protein